MSHSDFVARGWFVRESQGLGNGIADSSLSSNAQLHWTGKYFVSGWRGRTLASKSMVRSQNALNQLKDEILGLIRNSPAITRQHKEALFQEFIHFAAEPSSDFPFESADQFWDCVLHVLKGRPQDGVSKAMAKKIFHFAEIFCARASVVVALKIRVLSTLNRKVGRSFSEREILRPNATLNHIFQRSSSLELCSTCLDANEYTWILPTKQMAPIYIELYELLKDLSSSELIPVISRLTQPQNDEMKTYSHSLSHDAFGEFVELAFTELAPWIATTGKACNYNLKASPLVLEGDYLESLFMALHNRPVSNSPKCSPFLCSQPEQDFYYGKFFGLMTELETLVKFIAQFDVNSEDALLKSVTEAFNTRRPSDLISSGAQTSFLVDSKLQSYQITRQILMLCEFPKTNAHHYLVSRIQQAVDKIEPDGHLMVFSTQRLFVPSQKQKVEGLLSQIELLTFVDLEELKGRGEIPGHLYLFRKKNPVEVLDEQQQSCLGLRLRGELNTFSFFSKFTRHLKGIISNGASPGAMIFQEFDGVAIEGHPDFIRDGRLLSSTAKQSGQATHPNFFRNIMRSCTTLDQLFEVTPLRPKGNEGLSGDANQIFGLRSGHLPPIMLSLDKRMQRSDVDVFSANSLAAIVSSKGLTLCSYFALIPKYPGIDPNLLRDYFQSTLGQQVIDLVLADERSKDLTRVSSLLIPKFFQRKSTEVSHPLLPQMFHSQIEELGQISLSALSQELEHTQQLLPLLLKTPFASCQTLSALKRQLPDMESPEELDFTSVNLRNALTKLNLRPIFPHNPDIKLVMYASSAAELERPLSKVDLINDGEMLDLYSGDRKVVGLECAPVMSNFLRFLFQSGLSMPVGTLLQALQVPEQEDLMAIVDDELNGRELAASLGQSCDQLLDTLLIQSIMFSND